MREDFELLFELVKIMLFLNRYKTSLYEKKKGIGEGALER